MTESLRIGVIGLGRRWRSRYQPALRALGKRFSIRAVCDPSHDRAVQEARAVGAEVVSGPAALLERDDLDAVVYTGSSWYRLWPLELAARRRLPILCRLSSADALSEEPVLDVVCRSGSSVMVEMTPRCAPVTRHLRELLEQSLGPARVLLCDSVQRAASSASLLGTIGIDLVDWCTFLFGTAPATVLSVKTGKGFGAVVLEWSDGRIAELRRYPTTGAGSVRLRAIAERGTATVALPNVLRWSDGRARHMRRIREPQMGRELLEAFRTTVLEGREPSPNLHDLSRSLAVLRSAARSQAEGRRITIGET